MNIRTSGFSSAIFSADPYRFRFLILYLRQPKSSALKEGPKNKRKSDPGPTPGQIFYPAPLFDFAQQMVLTTRKVVRDLSAILGSILSVSSRRIN